MSSYARKRPSARRIPKSQKKANEASKKPKQRSRSMTTTNK